MVEDVSSLRLEERSKAGELRGAEGRMGALMGDASSESSSSSLERKFDPMVGVTSTATSRDQWSTRSRFSSPSTGSKCSENRSFEAARDNHQGGQEKSCASIGLFIRHRALIITTIAVDGS